MRHPRGDSYYRKAKREGYRSRAAYKLLELNLRFGLIRPGNRVVDLGSAPGGWLQVCARLAGPEGRVVGVDLQPIEPLGESQVFLLQGDIVSAVSQEKTRELLGHGADCVLSDLAPRLSGIRDADLSRSAELVRAALNFACALLKPGGSFLVKTFMGEGTADLLAELRQRFTSVRSTRPEATRKSSSEIYVIAKGFRGPPPVS